MACEYIKTSIRKKEDVSLTTMLIKISEEEGWSIISFNIVKRNNGTPVIIITSNDIKNCLETLIFLILFGLRHKEKKKKFKETLSPTVTIYKLKVKWIKLISKLREASIVWSKLSSSNKKVSINLNLFEQKTRCLCSITPISKLFIFLKKNKSSTKLNIKKNNSVQLKKKI